jgi:hypothetical protein
MKRALLYGLAFLVTVFAGFGAYVFLGMLLGVAKAT